jgi:phage shock protein PspC (stress-responsive transcriptional regulator)
MEAKKNIAEYCILGGADETFLPVGLAASSRLWTAESTGSTLGSSCKCLNGGLGRNYEGVGLMEAFPILFLIAIYVIIVIAAKLSSSRKGGTYPADQGYKVLCKSQSNRVFAGVCGGIAEYFGWSATIVRLFFIFTGIGLFTYIILAIVIPDSHSPLL